MVSAERRTATTVTSDQVIEVLHNPNLSDSVSTEQKTEVFYRRAKGAIGRMVPQEKEKLAHHVIKNITTTTEAKNYAFGMFLLTRLSLHESDASLLKDKYVEAITEMQKSNITRENIDKLLTVGYMLIPHISSKHSPPKDVLTAWDTVWEREGDLYMDPAIKEEIDSFKIELGTKYIENFSPKIVGKLQEVFVLKIQGKTDKEVMKELGITQSQYYKTYKGWLEDLIEGKRGMNRSSDALALQAKVYHMLRANPDMSSAAIAKALNDFKPAVTNVRSVLAAEGKIPKGEPGGKKSADVRSLYDKVQVLVSTTDMTLKAIAEQLDVPVNRVRYIRGLLLAEEKKEKNK